MRFSLTRQRQKGWSFCSVKSNAVRVDDTIKRWNGDCRPIKSGTHLGTLDRRSSVSNHAKPRRALWILKDNARPEAAAVYGALDMPWATLVGQISKAYGKQSAAAPMR